MADIANTYPDNTPGKYYVDNQCIDCDLCRETAPANFKRNDDGGFSFVYKQPENEDEERLCRCSVAQRMTKTGMNASPLFRALRSDILFWRICCVTS